MKVFLLICKKYFFLTVGLLLPFYCAMAQVPEASYVYPDAALNTQIETLHVYGDDFIPDSIVLVKLVANGCPDIVASSINVVSAHYLTCTFQFSFWTRLYDLVVSNASGEDTLYGCFTVYAGAVGQWQRSTVGVGLNYMRGAWVGDGDNNGLLEVYGSNYSGDLYRFEWNDSIWTMSSLGNTMTWAYDVCVGDGNNDGHIEVYAVYYPEEMIYQFKNDSAGWVITLVGSGATCVVVGDGDTDGEIEVYGASDNGTVYQYKWQDTVWTETVVGTGAEVIALGDGNNDGGIEVYGGMLFGDAIYQYKWIDTSWVRTVVQYYSDIEAITLGDGDNDNGVELYCALFGGSIYQYEWNGVEWIATAVASTQPVHDMTVGDGSGTGGQKLYAVCIWDTIREYEWSGANWIITDIGSGGQMLNVAVGDGNNDGQMEVYAADAPDYSMYQFKITEIGIEEKAMQRSATEPIVPGINYGNIKLPKTGEYKVYDITGRRIMGFGHILAPGIYFIETDGNVIHKVVVVK